MTNREWLNSLDDQCFYGQLAKIQDDCDYCHYREGECGSIPCEKGHLEWLKEEYVDT